MSDLVIKGRNSIFGDAGDTTRSFSLVKTHRDNAQPTFMKSTRTAGINQGVGKEILADFGTVLCEKGQAKIKGIKVAPMEEISDQAQNNKNISKSARWQNFTGKTTFHGIRYLFEDTPFTARRIVWALCVLAAVSTFLWQVVTRSLAYLEYESNVNVQVIYESQIPLPAVTICNQNRYRVSAASNMNVYKFLNDYYTYELTAKNFTNYDLDRINYSMVAFETAHQEDDLVEKCTWQGRPCNADNRTQLEPTYTDLGLCYTINGGEYPAQVTDAGSGMALRLTLNVEQYEYMKGPNGYAGVKATLNAFQKLLLHDANETPLMKDLGFSVAPGTHTLVATKRSKVNNLPHPYGTCVEDAMPMSECLARDKTNSIIESCGCGRLAYRNYTKDNTRLCNSTEAFDCVEPEQSFVTLARQSLRDGSNKGSSVSCATPCSRTLYEPSLSFAQLSKFNIEKFLLRNTEGRAKDIKTKLLAAKDTSQRVDKTAMQKNMETISEIKTIALELKQSFTETAQIYTTVDRTTAYYGVGDLATNGAAAVKNIVYSLYNEYNDILALRYSNVFCFTLYSLNLAQKAGSILGLASGLVGTGNTSQILQGLAVCEMANNETIINEYLAGNYNYSSPYMYDVLTSDVIGPLDDSLDGCMKFMSTARLQIAKIFDANLTLPAEYCTLGGFYLFATMDQLSFEQYPGFYASNITSWYHGTAMDPGRIPEHVQCKTFLGQANTNSDFQSLDMLVQYLSAVNAKGNFSEMKIILRDIDSLVKQKEGLLDPNYAYFIAGGLGSCGWMRYYNFHFNTLFYDDPYDQPEFVAWYDLRYIRLEQLTENFPQLGRQFNDMVLKLNDVKSNYEIYYKRLIDHLDRYTQGNITKLQLADFVTSVSAQYQLKQFEDKAEIFDTSARNLQTVSFALCGDLREFMAIFLNFKIPFFNNTLMLKTDLFSQIVGKSTNPIAIEHIMNFTRDHAYHFDSLVRMHCEPFTTYADAARFQIDDETSNLISALTTYKTEMKSFQDDNLMNDKFYLDNFLQVDIFYKELSYEAINQQVAFEALSLFSEVGGFLGLLLGASLLTVCELFDYLIISLLIQLGKKPDTPTH